MACPSYQVKYLQGINFSLLTLSEKIDIKIKGRPTPVLSLEENAKSRSYEYTRRFNKGVYEKHDWLCGCDEANALFCFPCLLFGGDPTWTKSGMKDLKHLQEKIAKHEKSAKHLHNVVSLSLLGSVNIAAEINSAYRLSVAKHNEQVRKNRAVLSKLVDCVKFCGKFELPLRGHDEGTSSKNPGVFRGIVEFACELDSSLKCHLETAKIFKGTSKTIQNEILESALEVCRNMIKEEVKSTSFVAVMCDETTDIYDKTQMVIVLRYELDGKPVERFWGFFNPHSLTAEDISKVLLEELQTLIGDCPHKLIAQTYDGAAALSGAKSGVQVRIKEVYSHAHFIHCYAHQLNLILEKAASQNSKVRVFFNSLSGIPAFFSNSPQRMATLESVADSHRIPRPSTTRWNFKSRTVNAVYEMKDLIIECCSKLESSNSKVTGLAAAGLKRILKDPEFNFWLVFFSKVMPHVDILYSQLQSRNIDAVKANNALNAFSSAVQSIRVACDECDNTDRQELSEPKRRKTELPETGRTTAAKEVCDVIAMQCRERFRFTNHLEASKLLLVNNFPAYSINFPNNELAKAVEAYPMLGKEKLRTELTVLYTREDLCKSQNLIDLLKIINDNNLQSAFSETVKLLKILITTPMTTAEAERCFSTLKRIKTFLRSTMATERLSALAMLSIESAMVTESKNFNEAVINNFVTSKSRRMDFIFK